jgi:hypothetical protein
LAALRQDLDIDYVEQYWFDEELQVENVLKTIEGTLLMFLSLCFGLVILCKGQHLQHPQHSQRYQKLHKLSLHRVHLY